MQVIDGTFVYSASDLNNYIECEHLVGLERLAALHELTRPDPDETTQLIARKGSEHEFKYAESLRQLFPDRTGEAGFVSFDERPARTIEALHEAEARTFAAMERGAKIIYQATFFDGEFVGYADFLRRVDTPSKRFPWNYEVIDTKLALHPKPYFLVQLCNYSEHVGRLTGTMPEHMTIVLGSRQERRFLLEDFAAYYRHLKASFLEGVHKPKETYPVVCMHCDICRWSDRCERQRDADDHLSIVAGMRRDQIERFKDSGITKIAHLASAGVAERPYGMHERTFENLQAQATLQHRQRTTRIHAYEFREIPDGDGFFKLTEPAAGDVFFDMEGDPLYRPERGLEYLFGAYLPDEDHYLAYWAKDFAQERIAFEHFLDFCVERLQKYPNLHIYHYAQYEVTALKRLAGRFASRGEVVDDFLRRGIFVDLFTVAKQSLRVSQPRYSLKKLEALYEWKRTTKTKRGDDSIVMFESWLATGDDELLEDIERYNEDDCRSTYMLREWLLSRRDELNLSRDIPVPWYQANSTRAPQEEPVRTELERNLLSGIAGFDALSDLREATPDIRARWLLGNMLQYHAREAKPEWWKYFERIANPNELEEHDNEALGGITWRSDIPGYKLGQRDRNTVYTFTYPVQEHNIKGSPIDPFTGKSAGSIVRIDDASRTLKVKLSTGIAPEDLRALIPSGPLATNAQRAAIEQVGQAYLDRSLERDFRATCDLLLVRKPHLGEISENSPVQPANVDAGTISQLIRSLENSYLFIQGPPGSGKSTKAAHAIVDLLAERKRVGILAKSHKAIHALLQKVEAVATERHVQFVGCHKETETEGSAYHSKLSSPLVASSNEKTTLTDVACQLGSGTIYAWSDRALVNSYDYLFIDEAGQIALAEALGCSLAAKNIVLLGDPLQLAQVSKASHPVGTDLSVLEHILGDHGTVPPDLGIFLDVSHRMHPEICAFISHAVYEDRLRSDEESAANSISSAPLSGSGLRYIGVEHIGNARKSLEEAESIVAAVEQLLQGSVTLRDNLARPLTQDDILIVAPYNAQRKLLTERLAAVGRERVRVGTVDKFQGQEAPVVFYSMATSSSEDIPRDMEFLFERNRLNVAISRAQCLSVLVCSPRLLEIRCSSPEQMALANLLCAFVEKAKRPAEASLF